MNLAIWLERNGRSFAERPAISVGPSPYLDFAAWARRTRAMAGGLSALGCRPGDRVAIVMSNRPEFLEAMFAAWHAGLVTVPVNAKLHREEIAYILTHSGSRLALASPDLAETVAPLEDAIAGLRVTVAGDGTWRRLLQHDGVDLVPRRGEDPAWLFYTSGTTGRPKGATLTHGNLLTMSLSYFADLAFIDRRDAILHAAPLSHGSGLYGLPHIARAANSVIPESGHFDPAEVASLIEGWPGLSLFAAPTMVTRLVGSPDVARGRLGNLKMIIYGGGPMYVADLKRALSLFGPRLAQIYGQGEAPMTITALSVAHHADSAHPRWEQRLGSAGLPRTDVEVRVVDEDDRDLPIGEDGEIVCRGPVVMTGYWGDAEATRRTLRDGWLHTGDSGSFDGEGFLTLKDRLKDLIISGGANIYPREIEEVLLRHPAVLETSVVGRRDPEWGEIVVAFVVRRPEAEVGPADLDRLCLESIARFKRPRLYRFVENLPKNNYGKVLKTELRRQLETETPQNVPG